MEQHHSLNMQLPRGWYQVAGVVPHTFRRHGLSTASGKLQVSLLGAAEELPADGETALAMLEGTLAQLDIAVGTPLSSGHEECACGILAHASYHHVGGQREYWIIPNDVATVFAAWEMGAKATAGMERHDIHEMLKKLFFDVSADEDAEAQEDPLASEEASA